MSSAARTLVAALALVGGTALVTAEIVRSQQDPPKPGEAPGMEMDPAMMARMMELATPGPEHEDLMKKAGKWENHYKMRMAPDQPWTEFDGTSESKTTLGGRYVLDTVKWEMMGMPMEGIHLLGYDKMKEEYISLWADSMSTWWVTSRGKADAKGTIEMKGTMVDVAGERPFRMVIRTKGEDLAEIEMYDTIPPHGELQVMAITSKRAK